MKVPTARLHPLIAAAALAVIGTCIAATWSMLQQAKAAAPATPRSGYSVKAEADLRAIESKPTTHAKATTKVHSQSNRSASPSLQPVAQIDPALGRISQIEVAEIKAQPSGVGAVGGGVVGGLLGNQIGKGDGRTVATVLGVVGGAVAGHHIERQVRTEKIWTISVRMDDGKVQTLTQKTAPQWQVGERVRVQEGRLVNLDGSAVPPAPRTQPSDKEELYRQA